VAVVNAYRDGAPNLNPNPNPNPHPQP
jgi:hypothetical protein